MESLHCSENVCFIIMHGVMALWVGRRELANWCFVQEEVRQLSDVRNLVNQLYEALNVEEHQLNKERELCGQLEELKVELEPLEQVSIRCVWAHIASLFTVGGDCHCGELVVITG